MEKQEEMTLSTTESTTWTHNSIILLKFEKNKLQLYTYFLLLPRFIFISEEAGVTQMVQEPSPSKSHLRVVPYLHSLPHHCC